MSCLIYSICSRDEAGNLVLQIHSEKFSPSFQARFLQWVPVLEKNIQQNQRALLDIPCNEQWRMILFPLTDQNQNIVFAALLLSLQNVVQIIAAGWNIYNYLLAAEQHGLAEIFLRDLDFSFPAECRVRDQIIQTSLKELQGWQMIGNPEKGIQCVVEMLAGIPVSQWFTCFFLAVNPVEYNNEYTTIVSVLPPDGTWKYMNMKKNSSHETPEEPVPAMPVKEKCSKKRKIVPVILWIPVLLLFGFGVYQIFWGIRAENRVLQKRLDHAESQVRMLIDENENLYKTVESLKENISKIHSSLEQKN